MWSLYPESTPTLKNSLIKWRWKVIMVKTLSLLSIVAAHNFTLLRYKKECSNCLTRSKAKWQAQKLLRSFVFHQLWAQKYQNESSVINQVDYPLQELDNL